MTEGDVVLTPLPRATAQMRNRPAVVHRAMAPHGENLVFGVTTQLHHETPDFEEVIRPGDLHFTASGLKAASFIRLGFLAALPISSFLGSIGSIAPERHGRPLQRLSEYLVRGREAGQRPHALTHHFRFLLNCRESPLVAAARLIRAGSSTAVQSLVEFPVSYGDCRI